MKTTDKMKLLLTYLGSRNLKIFGATLVLAGIAQVARAGSIPYPDSGIVNPVTYTFTAATTGDVIGYFAGSGAGYDEQVGLLVNGVLTGAGYGLDDHSSTVGDTFNFGSVTVGDTLTFVDRIIDFSENVGYVYSDPALNVSYDWLYYVDSHNHIYSTAAAAGQIDPLIPAGTYVAFEDLPFPGSDFNYFDDTFVFTNVATQQNGVPDGASTLSLLGIGLAGIGLLRRRVNS